MELPMVCTCRTDGIREVEDRRLRIFRRMRLKDMNDLAEAIVLSLAFDFQCDAEVYVDQWFGIGLETPLVDKSLFVPCDDPADGFAAVWEHLAERFPERVTKMDREPNARAAERISAALFERCVVTERDYEGHREGAHDGPNDCPPCEDCDVLLTLMISAHIALEMAWGRRSLDACVEAAFR
jgi:hypothetical protein